MFIPALLHNFENKLHHSHIPSIVQCSAMHFEASVKTHWTRCGSVFCSWILCCICSLQRYKTPVQVEIWQLTYSVMKRY